MFFHNVLTSQHLTPNKLLDYKKQAQHKMSNQDVMRAAVFTCIVVQEGRIIVFALMFPVAKRLRNVNFLFHSIHSVEFVTVSSTVRNLSTKRITHCFSHVAEPCRSHLRQLLLSQRIRQFGVRRRKFLRSLTVLVAAPLHVTTPAHNQTLTTQSR